ncbi:MAG: rob [Verrucomicrobia bacterium]|nr:rob [Verrucomicrobiota bacterium]
MKPAIIHLPAFTLVGPHAHFISAMSPDANNLKIIPPLYQQLFARKAEMPPPLDRFSYGACRSLPPSERNREDELEYMAGISVAPQANAPTGMGKWTVPAASYAHFIHRGPISQLTETISYAHASWLPRSGFQSPNGACEIERYDDRFKDGGEDSEMDYLLPIKLA